MNSLLFLVIGLVLPLGLWPIEVILPYPHIIEEVAKLLVVAQLVSSEKKGSGTHYWLIAGFGLAFTLSETILYTVNFWTLGNSDDLLLRLLLTGTLHIGTLLLLYFSYKMHPTLSVIAVLVAIMIHYLYNTQLAIML